MNRPPPAPRFDKRLRLLGWALVHRVPPEQRDLATADLAKATKWFGGKAPHEDAALGAVWKEWIRGVLDRRARRRAWMQRHGSVPDGWTPPRGWETRPNTKPPEKKVELSKRAANKAAYKALRGPTCRELEAMRREQRAAIKARVEAMCLASGRDSKTGRKLAV